jgi:hypothetical protein
MTLFMDVHSLDGTVRIEDVVQARKADLMVQPTYGVRFLRYWVCEERGIVFCLVDAPSAIAAATVHLEAHGGVAQEVVRVSEGC